MRGLPRFSGSTELTDSGSQSRTISGHQLAAGLARARSGRALPPTSSHEPRVAPSESSNRVPVRTHCKRLVFSGLESGICDFEDPHELAKFAATVGMSLDEFRQEFEYLAGDEPPPLVMDSAGEKV